jgi:hypothetical protein
MSECKVQEGIYLQTKKSIIGTGSTAKQAEYRNFWATLSVGETHVEMILLDDAFLLTGIREKFTLGEVADGPNWLYVEQGEKKYSQLKPRLESILNPQPKPPSAPKPGMAKPGVPRPPFVPGGAKKPAAKPPVGRKDGWWNK